MANLQYVIERKTIFLLKLTLLIGIKSLFIHSFIELKEVRRIQYSRNTRLVYTQGLVNIFCWMGKGDSKIVLLLALYC